MHRLALFLPVPAAWVFTGMALVVGSLVPGCGGSSPTVKVLASGVRVEILESGSGASADADRMLVFHYDTRLADGSLVDSSRGRDRPHAAFLDGESVLLPGLLEGLRGLRAGSRALLVIPPEQAYGAVGKGKIPANATLHVEVELLAVAARTDRGTQIHILEAGDGEAAATGDHVVLKFRGYTEPSGREFWSDRQSGQPLEFQVGEGQVLAGLEDAVQGMRPGAKAICLLPPDLAFGPTGSLPDVPPNKHVWFELELMGVRSNR